MTKPITAIGFKGMNNLPNAPGHFIDHDSKKIIPGIAMNVEVTDGGLLVRRGGFAKKITLAGVHSLWGGSVFLGVAAGVLYHIEGVTARAIGAVTGPPARLQYVEIDNLIYMSNPYWKGVYEVLTGTVRPWGVALPAAPSISMTTGDLPPGAYTLCYTQASGGRISGNGPLVQVSWEGGAQGIRLNNLPAGGQCWITHPNGQNLFLASVTSGVVTGQVPKAIPLPSLMVSPPPGFSDFCHAFGRIWGVYGKKVYYSGSFQYEWFRPANFFPFLEELVMVAPVNEGIFVNSLGSTWFLDGTEPGKMTVRRVGDGAIPGSLTMATMPGSVVGGGYEISRLLSAMPSPVWMSKTGFCVGTHTGHLVHLTESRLKVNPRAQGASLAQIKNGIPQILTSLHGVKVKDDVDADLDAVFANGQIF